MAFILGQDEEKDQQQAGSGVAPLTGGQTASIAGGAPTATGVGKGGQGGWTNLQNYISANQGDTGSTQALNQSVGGQFGQESQNMQKQSSDFVAGAEDQVNKAKISNEDADGLINSSAGLYSYGGQQADEYTQNVGKVQGALTNAYSGPKEYSYGLGAKTQEYGNALGKDGNFDGLLKNLYSERTKSPLSQGQYNLQKQLDVHNSSLNDARTKLAGDYEGLGKQRDQTVQQTTEQLGGLEQQYRTNQNALRDYLSSQSNKYDTEIGQAEADARAAYDKDFRGASNLAGAFSNREAFDPGTIYPYVFDGTTSDRHNLTWNQQQREQDLVNNRANPVGNELWQMIYGGKNPNGSSEFGTIARDSFGGNANALSNFYSTQDTKYENTADEQERKYNALQDFLNSDAARKEQGFRVRGK